MKKVWLIVALVALGGLAVNTFADVQNIRLSGDIRIRGYYLTNTGETGSEGFWSEAAKSDTSFISQRTRVSVEADLEDHVLVVVTLKAEGLWGQNNQTDDVVDGSGAGQQTTGWETGIISRNWDIGVSEAYVQLNEVFYTPATLKIGRQYLHYGHGLILSSAEQEYNYDAARLVLDYYPLTIDVVGAKLIENSAFGPNGPHGGADLLFLNARYELSDSLIKNVEGYFGWLSQGDVPANATRVPPSLFNASPVIIGLRSDINLTEGLNTWVEGAYEFGSDGTTAGNGISAFLFNVGGKYTFKKDTQWSPAINANYIYASGGGADGEHGFRPWFDYAEGYNGFIFAPALSNIQIINLGVSIKPSENTTLSLQGYYYLAVDEDSAAGSNPNADWGGPLWAQIQNGNNADSRLGFELDGILGYDYSKDVRCQLVVAAFFPGKAYNSGAGLGATGSSQADKVVEEVRGEINVKF